MPLQRPKLRDAKKLSTHELYPLNVFPDDLIKRLGGYLVYLVYIGRKDISGDDFGDAFAEAVGGTHLASPLGIADVVLGKSCWSAKTVKAQNPFNSRSVRLISGRCSPDYSYGITDPHEDLQKTGTAVLGIWNERVNIATDNYSQVRTAVLVRSYDLQSYLLFEEETGRFRTTDFQWSANNNGNLIGYDEEENQRFTWQPHGSQFTIHCPVPSEAVKFTIKLPPQKLNKKDVLEMLKFDDSWITIFRE